MFGSFLPSLGCMTAIKSTQVEGADIVMKSSGFRDRRVTGVTRSGRQTSGQSPGRRTRRSAVAQDYLRDGDFTHAIPLLKKSVFRVADGILRVPRREERPLRFPSANDASSRLSEELAMSATP